MTAPAPKRLLRGRRAILDSLPRPRPAPAPEAVEAAESLGRRLVAGFAGIDRRPLRERQAAALAPPPRPEDAPARTDAERENDRARAAIAADPGTAAAVLRAALDPDRLRRWTAHRAAPIRALASALGFTAGADPEPEADARLQSIRRTLARDGLDALAADAWTYFIETWFPAAASAADFDEGESALALLYRRRPRPADDRDRPILSAALAQIEPDDPRAGTLFSVARHANPDPAGPPTLPGFAGLRPNSDHGPSLPLNLYDLGNAGNDPHSRRAAALALRIFVEAVLSVPPDLRQYPKTELDPIRLRDFLARLYPDPSYWRPSRHWPTLRQAFEALDSAKALIPWEGPDGSGGLRRVVIVENRPRSAARLNDWIEIMVNLPPGSDIGPSVDRPRLRHWGVTSDACYRAMLGLAYDWFRPGVTRFPVRGGRHWLQSNDPSRYPALDRAAVVARAFPAGPVTRMRLLRARKALGQLADAGDCRIVEADRGRIRVLPPLPRRDPKT